MTYRYYPSLVSIATLIKLQIERKDGKCEKRALVNVMNYFSF